MTMIEILLSIPKPLPFIAPQGKHSRQEKSYYSGFTKYLKDDYKRKPLVAIYPKNILTAEIYEQSDKHISSVGHE